MNQQPAEITESALDWFHLQDYVWQSIIDDNKVYHRH